MPLLKKKTQVNGNSIGNFRDSFSEQDYSQETQEENNINFANAVGAILNLNENKKLANPKVKIKSKKNQSHSRRSSITIRDIVENFSDKINKTEFLENTQFREQTPSEFKSDFEIESINCDGEKEKPELFLPPQSKVPYLKLKDDIKNDEKLAPFNKKKLTHKDHVDMTTTGFQASSLLVSLGYDGLKAAHTIKPPCMPLTTMRTYLCAGLGLEVLYRFSMHFYNFIEISRSHHDRKRRLLLECLDTTVTLAFGAATILSLLSNINVLAGMLATVCMPLGPIASGFCTVVMGLIELAHCYKAAQQLKLEVMLRDRLKRFSRISAYLDDKSNDKDLAAYYKKDLQEERDAMREQILAFAHVGFLNEEIDEKTLSHLLKNQLTEKQRKQFDIKKLTKNSATGTEKKIFEIQQKIFKCVRGRHREAVRSHALNGVFWILSGIGACLLAASAFFPPVMILVIIGGALTALSFAVKATELLEIDKRVHNHFAGEDKQKTIEYDNVLTNYLARRSKEKDIIAQYKKDNESQNNKPIFRELKTLKNVIKEKFGEKDKSFSIEDRIKMCIAYELSMFKCAKSGHEQATLQPEFYKQLLQLSWWQRRKILNNAMERKLERDAFSSDDYSTVAKGLTKEDRKYFMKKWCRKDYGLFAKKSKVKSKNHAKFGKRVMPAINTVNNKLIV